MRAAVITRFGDPDVLEVRDVPTPVPGTGEVLIHVRATALNRADVLQRMGRYPAPGDVAKDIPGIEYAGEVTTPVSGASAWSKGDRVFGLVGGGAHAQFVVAHEDTLLRVPDGMRWTDAAAIPEAFITAHDAMIVQAGLRPGEVVLIHAVGSGVGLAATQLARAFGGIPYGSSRTRDKIEQARPFGLEDGIVVATDMEPLVTASRQWTGGRGVDVVLDLVGGAYVPASIDALALKGRLMLVGTVAGPRATIELHRVLGKRLTIRGTVLRARPLDEKIVVTEAFERDVMPRLRRGELRANVDSTFPLASIRDAHRRMESNASFGKVVVLMD
ncbi:MAG: NAD(P)H-quinone oxidoreductase [Gemmatimonadaceae bacterium]